MKLRLPGRVPFGLRAFFRGAFLLLALATAALAVSVLLEEKRLSYRNYEDLFRKNQAQIVTRLQHPAGQLALLNPQATSRAVTPLRPWVLPFSAIDFDDRAKVQQAVEMAGCLVQYPDSASMCVAVGNNPFAGGFIYLAGSFASGALVAHTPGDLDLGVAHRVRVSVQMRGEEFRWIAPFESMGEASSAAAPSGAGLRGRLTGFVDDLPITPASRPVRDFRGWLWQEGRCIDPKAEASGEPCLKRSFMSIRLPIEIFREALFQKTKIVWPPPDLDQILVHVQMLAPGDGAPIFDSDAQGARLPFSLADLTGLLLPGETLRVRKLQPDDPPPRDLVTLVGTASHAEPSSPWLDRLIRALPVEGYDTPIAARESIATPLGSSEMILTGDVRTVNKSLAAVTTRISWFVAAMLTAIVLTWLAIEIRIIRRITLLTKRAAAVSTSVRAAGGLSEIDLTDLRGGDELGVLAQGLKDLLQRVNEDIKREHIRAEQEKDTWHAVGHEIMSPLQSLMALHESPHDTSHRYISRMQQAVRVLYGSASPSEAFQSTSLQLQAVDLEAFLVHVAGNASFIGVADVQFRGNGSPVWARADDYSLEDVVTHVLRNADRYRKPGTPILIDLSTLDHEAQVTIHNQGPAIDDALIDKIFEYGVSDPQAAGAAAADAHRGQGLFVARTYMAKMAGTITARNATGGAEFVLTLQRQAAGGSAAPAA